MTMLENPYYHNEDAKRERGLLRRAVVLPVVLALILLLTLAWTKKAYAAPRVHSAEECSLVADMVLVAASLRKNAVEEAKGIAVMADTYASVLTSPDAKRWQEIAEGARRLAKRPEARDVSPSDLANMTVQACHQSRGNLDNVFGIES